MSTYNDSFTLTFISRFFCAASTQESGAISATRRKRVICLDDDPLSLRLLEVLLKDTYDVHSCGSIYQAIRVSQKYAIDTFICDYHLGSDMTGAKALGLLAELNLIPTSHKILITARPTPEIEAEVRAAGFTHIFSKPLGRDFQNHCRSL